MKVTYILSFIMTFALCAQLCAQDDPVIKDYDKAKMDKAITTAKGNLDKFIDSLKNKKAKYYALKVEFQTDDGKDTEHSWIGYLEVKGDKIVGKMDSVPAGISKIKAGDVIEIDMTKVSDWLIVNGKNLYGGYTTRVLEEVIPEKDRVGSRGMKWQADDADLP